VNLFQVIASRLNAQLNISRVFFSFKYQAEINIILLIRAKNCKYIKRKHHILKRPDTFDFTNFVTTFE
jgi:hypothetical protein